MNGKTTTAGETISSPQPTTVPTSFNRTPARNPDLLPHAPHYVTRNSIPNTPLAVSAISAALGALAAGGLVAAAQPALRALGSSQWGWARPSLGLYAVAMGMFHLCEFWTTAGWNPQKLSVDAFLLNNGKQYHYAHAVGLCEYFLSSYFFPRATGSVFNSVPYLLAVSLVLIGAQILRSLAMIHANKSFSHIVKNFKHDDHTLITHGVYAYSRHPSYVGFFFWAVATQLLLGNLVSACAFVFVLSRFFSSRIVDEEKHLVKFFGEEYVQYRKRVGTCLPFKTSE